MAKTVMMRCYLLCVLTLALCCACGLVWADSHNASDALINTSTVGAPSLVHHAVPAAVKPLQHAGKGEGEEDEDLEGFDDLEGEFDDLDDLDDLEGDYEDEDEEYEEEEEEGNTAPSRSSVKSRTPANAEPNDKKSNADSSSSMNSVWVRVPLLIVVTLACILVC
ncbi:uncharacterized protein TM35_000451250 [Trypanosoma theileri]|uniref:Uncharacterized protein n=1 Tax=Trypanosoma theileri TaxID=67003 RepID=A0A1X0NIB6_9TRYP|nr:uncharacterized protein TM35_000451250 [Trypanosoma theileri]ORC84387.1 hypothetical protein TM35_000451250 [Trypanosoma theileri]